MNEPAKHSPWFNRLAGLAFVAMGLFPMLAAFDIGPLNRHDIQGPPWLGLVSGGVFVLAGIAIALGESAKTVRTFIAVLIVLGLAAIGNWIAFGVGERACSVGIGYTDAGTGYSSDGLACRIPFGFGALLIDLIILYGVLYGIQKWLGASAFLQRGQKMVSGLLILLLLPLLLLLFVPTLLGVVKTRLTTGQWPRNEAFIRRKRGDTKP